MNGGRGQVYRCAASIVWVKDAGRTILVEEEQGRTWALAGVEAVIWDLLTLRYSVGRLTGLLAVLLGQPEERAAKTLGSVIQRWEAEGIVQAVERGGHG